MTVIYVMKSTLWGFTRFFYSWTNRTFSRLTMQIGSTISKIHLKNTNLTYTVAAPAPQNTPGDLDDHFYIHFYAVFFYI